jgi:formate dehydrogenase assembly factor FdhD
MVAKAAGIGIPVFVSPAAHSIEAVAPADSAGMMLCGRTSETGFNVYSHQERII